MTAVSEVADAFGPAPKPATAPVQPVPAMKPAKVRAASGSRLSGVPAVAARAARTVAADFTGAWPWRGTPPTLAELVADRIPDRERVPGRNLALWVSWTIYNHVALVLFVLAYPALWVLSHPARLLLAAVLAAPLLLFWI